MKVFTYLMLSIMTLFCQVVTGSTHGIGKAFAQELASFGLNIVILSLGNEDCQNMAAFLGNCNVHCWVLGFALWCMLAARLFELATSFVDAYRENLYFIFDFLSFSYRSAD